MSSPPAPVNRTRIQRTARDWIRRRPSPGRAGRRRDLRSSGPKSALVFFNDTAPTEIYTLSLHDALPISPHGRSVTIGATFPLYQTAWILVSLDRKSTRLNSSHSQISYAVFCLKKNR